MKRIRKLFYFGLFFLVMVAFFLYALFPSDIARDLIANKIAQTNQNVQVTIDSVHPTFPPGLKLAPVSFSYAAMPVFSVEKFTVKPGLISLLGSEKHFSFFGPMGNGDFAGRADLLMDEKRPQTKISINLKQIPITAIDLLKQYPQYKLNGDINGNIDYDSRKGTEGTASVSLNIASLKIEFNPPLMGLAQLEFSQAQTDMILTPRMLQIRRCDASGPQLESRISGSIIFRQPFDESRVTLSCTLKPQSAFAAEHKSDMIGGLLGNDNALKRGIVIRISGTLSSPRYVIR
jgi:type II secretion system protein N